MEIKNINRYIYKIDNLSIPNLLKQEFFVFDLEATGLNPKTESITQIGGVPVIKGKIYSNRAFNSFIRPFKKIPPKISRLTGITNQDIKKAPELKTILDKLWPKYKNYTWVAQCGFEFDFKILQENAKKNKISYFKPKELDTKVLFAYLHPELNTTFSTDFLKDYYKVNFSDLKRHTALGDAILIARILKKMLEEFKSKAPSSLIIKKTFSIKKFVPKPLN